MSELFATVFGISLTTGAIAALIMLLSPLTGKRYAAKWRFWIWAVLALRLLIPINFIPASGSVPEEPAMQAQVQPAPIEPRPAAYPRIELTIPENLTEPIATPERAPEEEPAVKLPEITPLGVIAAVWAFGAALCFAVQIADFLMLRHRIIKYGAALTESGASVCFEEACAEMAITKKPRLMLCKKAPSPMIIGFLKPRLVLTRDDGSDEQLRFIIRHELIHYKRRDVWFKLLFALAVSVH